jgi:aspartyl-tRNA(Asn)/glutamyl-tRNA(Gln) amidotransferase subunit A
MSAELHLQTVAQLSAALEAGTISAVELTRTVIARTQAVEGRVHAFNSRDEADALAQAAASDARRSAGQGRGALEGIPISLKDVIAVAGQPLTASSRMLANFVSPYDATVTTKLKAAGAVLWGRANCDEFAMGSSTENSAFGPTRNPWDLTRVPGGSSGGSAAALAAGEAIATLGSDTGGSIRQPAALCGIVGLKPTYGLRLALRPRSPSLPRSTRSGPSPARSRMRRSCCGAIAGHDRTRLDLFQGRDSGLPRRAERPPMARGSSAFRRSISARASTRRWAPPLSRRSRTTASWAARSRKCRCRTRQYCLDTYYMIATAEASSNLARYDGIRYGHRVQGGDRRRSTSTSSRAREGFGAEVKRRIILGTYVLSSGYYDAYYLRAQKVRTLIRQRLRRRPSSDVDALLTPTSPTPAFKLGEKADPLALYLCDIYTIGVNLAGLPAISRAVRTARTRGLPIGAAGHRAALPRGRTPGDRPGVRARPRLVPTPSGDLAQRAVSMKHPAHFR